MPTPRKYSGHAERQAAYRRRTTEAIARMMAQKGLPAPSPIPAFPSTRRWGALIRSAVELRRTVHAEMDEYYNDRSEDWLEGDRAIAFEERMAEVWEAISAVEALAA
jgi:hypothetical protein